MNYSLLVYVSLLVSPLLGLFEEIGQEHSKSFSFELPPTPPQCGKYSEYLHWIKRVQSRLSGPERKRIVFKLFSQHEEEKCIKSGNVLDVTTWQDLNLLSGPVSQRSAYLAAKIPTSTVLGEATILRMIADPLDEVSELKKRQSLVREFVNNAALFELSDTALKQIKKSEHHLYSLWLEEDIFKQNSQDKYIRVGMNFSLVNAFNKNSLCLEAVERFEEVNQVLSFGSSLCAAVTLPVVAGLFLFNPQRAKTFKESLSKGGIGSAIGLFSIFGIINYFMKDRLGTRIPECMNSLSTGIFSAFSSFYSYDNIISNAFTLSTIQERLIAIADCVRLLKELHLHEQLKGLGTIQSRLNHFFTERPQESADFKLLLELLESPTFQDEASFFSRAGRILTTFKLLNENKDAFIEAFVVLGELDAYCSIARLYKQAPEAWSFADYQEEGPYVELHEFWNPFLDQHHAVTNSITLGGTDHPRMIITTGPNAGGKSTTMKAVLVNLILGQSIGIVPAKSCRATVFKKLRTYLTITDDIAAGNSHFKAGVLRAQELIEVAKSLSDGHYGCFALDEVFNGTSYKEGQAAAYSLIEAFGNNPFLVGITATHFPLVTELENLDPARFKNYKVSVGYDSLGKIQYPFKLQPGIAHQHVALDILREEGFEPDFLKRANQLLTSANACAAA